MSHEKILNMLSKLAENAEDFSRAKLAACILHKGEIVSFGFNRKKSHPFQKKYGRNDDSIFLHAETDAIHRASKFLTESEFKKSTLYVARIKKLKQKSKNFVWGLSKPCEGCSRAIAEFGIKNVIYTSDIGCYECL